MSVEELFLSYTADYVNDNSMCSYKVDHSFRVRDIAIKIGKSINLSVKDLELLNICGVLHDIGRFEQFRRYETFVDSDCVSHCQVGYDVLSSGTIFDELNLDDSDREIVLCVALNHGVLKVDDGIVGRKRKFLDIIRDADKLDILDNGVLGNISLNIGDDVISDKIYQNIFNHETVNLDEKTNRADRICVWFAFAFGLNFRYSFRYLEEFDIMSKLGNIYRDKTCNEECKRQITIVCEEVKKYIRSKVGKGEIVC